MRRSASLKNRKMDGSVRRTGSPFYLFSQRLSHISPSILIDDLYTLSIEDARV
jgi:hypothetical protein